MSKATGSPFGRPQRDFDAQAFLEGGVAGLRAPEPAKQREAPVVPPTPPAEEPAAVEAGAPAHPPITLARPAAAILAVNPPAIGRGRPKDAIQDRRSTASYKHREANHEKLRLLAHRLDRPMGELLDEALERMFPEWVAQLPAEPRF